MANISLNEDDRDFFSLLSKVVYSNPFADERVAIIKLLSPEHKIDPERPDHQFNWISPALNKRIAKLESNGLNTIGCFKDNDRQLMEDVFLFQIYLRYVESFDKLIENQILKPKISLDVSFAEEAISLLIYRGFTDQDSLNYFAFFYQIRRAYYFIVKSLIGNSSSMQQLRCKLWTNIFTHDLKNYSKSLWSRMEDFSTMLLGDTGTGKGSAAAAIGRSGFIPYDQKKGQFGENFVEIFISINLCQYPENLIESELFGHRKGSFTGAVDEHKGVFELCNIHGALFLDEIGDVTVPIQIKLLRVLQDRIFTSIGSHDEKRFKGRVIAATNHDIYELRKLGHLRDDLYYRLCSDVITFPTLQQRISESTSELEVLVDSLITRITGERNIDLNDLVLNTLKKNISKDYAWPGNVRELEQAIRSIILTHDYTSDSNGTNLNSEDDFLRGFQDGSFTVSDLISRYCNTLYKRYGSYEEVARRTKLDRRTVKKYLQ
jgi:DNA-binding NtrC family response regulator